MRDKETVLEEWQGMSEELTRATAKAQALEILLDKAGDCVEGGADESFFGLHFIIKEITTTFCEAMSTAGEMFDLLKADGKEATGGEVQA